MKDADGNSGIHTGTRQCNRAVRRWVVIGGFHARDFGAPESVGRLNAMELRHALGEGRHVMASGRSERDRTTEIYSPHLVGQRLSDQRRILRTILCMALAEIEIAFHLAREPLGYLVWSEIISVERLAREICIHGYPRNGCRPPILPPSGPRYGSGTVQPDQCRTSRFSPMVKPAIPPQIHPR